MVRKITKYKIISLFLNNYSKKFYLRELAGALNKPHQTIKPYVEELVKENVLSKEKRKNIIDYFLNFQSQKIWDYIIISEKEISIEKIGSELLIKTLFEKLYPFFIKNTFIVFGSSVDKIKKGSDIDLLIIGKSDLSKTLSDFEEIYNKKIHKIQITTLNQLDKTLLREIYKKHLIFNNTESIINFFRLYYEKNKMV